MVKIETDQQYAHVFCKWLESKFDFPVAFDPSTTRTIGHVEFQDGKINILAVAAFHRWSPFGCEVTIASNGEKKKKASHAFIHTCFDFVFNHSKKLSLFSTIAVDNAKSIAVAHMLGLSKRGEIPEFFGPGKAGAIYTITKDEWLAGRFAHLHDEPINREHHNKDTEQLDK